MKLLTVKIQGQELTADLLNPEIVKKFEDGYDAVLECFRETEGITPGSEGIRKQCQAVIDYVTDIFGETGARKVFGAETDLLTWLDVMEEMQNVYPEQVTPVIREKAEKWIKIAEEGE